MRSDSQRQASNLPTGARSSAAVAPPRVPDQGRPPAAPVDWSPFGTVLPVLAAAPGAGGSVVATVLADALQLAHRNVLMVDAADPPRSGLALATGAEGGERVQPHPRVGIRYSWRGRALVAQLETSLPTIAPGMVPPPRWWRPPVDGVHVTVVDLGHDAWHVTADPRAGAGAWLRRGTPHPRPVLVARATRPSLQHAEQILARLEPFLSSADISPVTQLVVSGVKRWPAGVAGAAGRRVTALLESAVFVPHDAELAVSGITAAVTPQRLRQAVTPTLRRWGLIAGPQPGGTGRREPR